MSTTATKPTLDSLDELFGGKPSEPRTDTDQKLDAIAKLKAKLNAPTLDVHDTDRNAPPEKLQQLVKVMADIAVCGRMFRRDPQDDHERTPAEVRQVVTALCRKRGTSAVMDMVLDWKGFRLNSLPAETREELSRALDLAADFWKKQ